MILLLISVNCLHALPLNWSEIILTKQQYLTLESLQSSTELGSDLPQLDSNLFLSLLHSTFNLVAI